MMETTINCKMVDFLNNNDDDNNNDTLNQDNGSSEKSNNWDEYHCNHQNPSGADNGMIENCWLLVRKFVHRGFCCKCRRTDQRPSLLLTWDQAWIKRRLNYCLTCSLVIEKCNRCSKRNSQEIYHHRSRIFPCERKQQQRCDNGDDDDDDDTTTESDSSGFTDSSSDREDVDETTTITTLDHHQLEIIKNDILHFRGLASSRTCNISSSVDGDFIVV